MLLGAYGKTAKMSAKLDDVKSANYRYQNKIKLLERRLVPKRVILQESILGVSRDTVESDSRLAKNYFKDAFTWTSGDMYDKARAAYTEKLGENNPFVTHYMVENTTVNKLKDHSLWQKCYDYANCTDLSASLMYVIWGKVQTLGNGMDVAKNWAAAFGGKVSKTPHAGSVFSSPPTPDNSYGHTGVVVHVFATGEILIAEQNYAGFSGAQMGMAYSWNYRLVTKKEWQNGWSFYKPQGQPKWVK